MYERSRRDNILLNHVILASIFPFTLFCCKLVFAVTYALWGKKNYGKKTAGVTKITFSMSVFEITVDLIILYNIRKKKKNKPSRRPGIRNKGGLRKTYEDMDDSDNE